MNKRAKEEFITNYFYYLDLIYLYVDERYSHLYNIDSIFKYYIIEKELVEKLNKYKNKKCEFNL